MEFLKELYDFCMTNEKFLKESLGAKMSIFLAGYFSIAEGSNVPYETVEQIVLEALRNYPNAPKEDYANN